MIDSRYFPVIKYIVQVCFSASVAVFSMTMLATGSPVEIYLPVVTGIVGYWLPQPSLKHKQEDNVV